MHPYAIALLALVGLSLMPRGAVGLPIYYWCRGDLPESGAPGGWRRLFAFLPRGARDSYSAAPPTDPIQAPPPTITPSNTAS
jgi:hypothetical protein